MTKAQNKQSQKSEQVFQIKQIYVKDLSFEAPLGPRGLSNENRPRIEQELGTAVKSLDDDLYEIILKLNVTAKTKDSTAFIVEVQQAGIFLVKGFDEDANARMINATCPQTLYPYGREVIDSTLIKGGFPPLYLPHVNFKSLFAKAMAEQKSKEA